jgi:NADH-quinone oxidoreductase subunit A
MDGWIGILVLMGLAVALASVMVLASSLLGPRNPTPEKLAPYECGMPAVGDARERQSVKFYLVAMIFLLFDIEIAFLFPWALALRSLGWFGFVQVITFFLILSVGYLYVWRKGVFDWGPLPRVIRRTVPRTAPVLPETVDTEGRLHGGRVA